MESRLVRARSSSTSLSRSRSRSPISNSERRSVSTSPRRGPSTPVKSSVHRSNNDDEQDPGDRTRPAADQASKVIADEISSPSMSDTEESHQKKRSHHGHHHRHRHEKQSKSTKRSISHHRQSAKRSKKETPSTSRNNQSDDENSVHSPGRNTSESEPSPTKKEASPSDDESNEEEGVIEGNSTPSDHRSGRRQHRKKRHSSSTNNDRNSQSPQSPSGTTPKSNKGTQLIVNYLPESLNEADFYQLFARVAPVKLCKLITDRYTGHSYCYGFIEYHGKDDAAKAIKKYNGYGIEHKKLKVSYAQPKSKTNTNTNMNDGGAESNKRSTSSSTQKNPNVYITELPDTFDEKMLKRLFSKHGEIVQAKILRDPRTRISRGVGFVLMTSTRYAERAIKALDGHVPSGAQRPISVKYADPKKSAAAAATTTASGHGSSLPRHSNAAPVSGMIGSYGYPPGFPSLGMIDPYYAAALHHQHRTAMNMRDLSPSPPPPPPPMPSYYGNRNSRSSRMRSASPGVSRSYSSSSSSKHNSNNLAAPIGNSSSLAAAYDLIAKGCQQAIDPNGFVIYAFGLPRDCVEHELEELFQRYGDVYRVYIVKNYTTGESKGYSFITMRNYDEACHAIDSLHNSTFQGRTIQVRFKQ